MVSTCEAPLRRCLSAEPGAALMTPGQSEKLAVCSGGRHESKARTEERLQCCLSPHKNYRAEFHETYWRRGAWVKQGP